MRIKVNNELIKYYSSAPIATEEVKGAMKQTAIDLKLISELYGIPQPTDLACVEMVKVIIQCYPTLRQQDIKHAFQLAAQGKLNVSLELYGKPMNLWLIHQVLTSFLKARNKEIKMLKEKQRILELEKNPRTPMPKELRIKMEELHKKIEVENKSNGITKR